MAGQTGDESCAQGFPEDGHGGHARKIPRQHAQCRAAGGGDHRRDWRSRRADDFAARRARCCRPGRRSGAARLAVQLRVRRADRRLPPVQGRRLHRSRRSRRYGQGSADSHDHHPLARQQEDPGAQQPDHGRDDHQLFGQRHAAPGHDCRLQLWRQSGRGSQAAQRARRQRRADPQGARADGRSGRAR
jgi:hypothetical protein